MLAGLLKISFTVLFISLLCFSSCNREEKPRPNTSIPPKYAIQKEPMFINQGTLSIIRNNVDTIISIEIELSDTPAKREMGLMHRKSMQGNQGMLFIFDKEERQSFWMKDTHIPIDIVFVNAEKNIVHIAQNCQPYSLKSIPSFEYALYVVEVNAGFTQKHAINVGDKIGFQLK